jgi:CHRD domain
MKREFNMKIRTYFAISAVLAICIGVSTTSAYADDDSGRRLRATLKGFNETPANSTSASGSFRAIISDDQTSITFELNYSDLVADSLFAHIHLGQKNVAGGVMIFFCDNSTPSHSPRTCPTRGGTVTGTVTAEDVVGPDGQGIAPGDFSKVIEAIRTGVTYVNVHSTKFPTGEIRGQVRVVGRHDDNKDDH